MTSRAWQGPVKGPRVDPLELGPPVREHGPLAGSNVEGTWERPAFDGRPRVAHYVMPDTCADVIFSIDWRGRIEALVTGPASSFATFPSQSANDYVGARVRAGFGRPLLESLGENRIAAVSIRKTRLPVIPSRALAKEEARLWLAERLGDLTSGARWAPPVWIVEAIRLIGANEVGSGAIEIARRVGVSPRTLRRGFLDWVGLSPKRMMRLERAKRAAGVLLTGLPAVQVAAELDFADQAHMIRELRAVLGVVPGHLLRSDRVADLFKSSRKLRPNDRRHDELEIRRGPRRAPKES